MRDNEGWNLRFVPSRGMSTGIGVYHFKIVGKSFQRRLSKTAKGSKKTFYYLKIVGKSWSACLMKERWGLIAGGETFLPSITSWSSPNYELCIDRVARAKIMNYELWIILLPALPLLSLIIGENTNKKRPEEAWEPFRSWSFVMIMDECYCLSSFTTLLFFFLIITIPFWFLSTFLPSRP